MKQRYITIVLSSLCLMVAASTALARMESSNFVIFGDVFSGGGSELSTSANFGIQDSIGEAVILSATTTSANFGIKAGFRELYPDDFVSLTITNPNIDFGLINSGATAADSHDMAVATNVFLGMTVTMTGATLTNGADQIDALATTTAAQVGVEQFGINLVDNTTPNIGTNPTAANTPMALVSAGYHNVDAFRFVSGETVVESPGPIYETDLSVSYIANVSGATEPGDYNTTLTYTAVGNF